MMPAREFPIGSTRLQPVVTTVFLPRCAGCGGKHPLAYRPARAASTCPECGLPQVAPAPPVETAAVLAEAVPIHARVLLRVGAALARFSKGA